MLYCRRVAGAGRHPDSIEAPVLDYILNLPFGTCPEKEREKKLFWHVP